jgi:hypothetical protein
MTTTTPAPGNDPSSPKSTEQTLLDCQWNAMILEGLFDALELLDDAGWIKGSGHAAAIASVRRAGEVVAKELSADLDRLLP